MKNSNYFPFERNKYFYGKLLSVDDFELEQKYMNDKRRMLNRFLFGTGVVAGLNVVRVDEQTVSVEAGIALDSWGREMVVDVPIMKKLSMLEGFDACHKEDTGFAYLCLEYDEEETDKVHNIAGSLLEGQEDSDLSFNKIKEGYRLFLTDEEPEGDMVSPSDWYQASQVICQEGDIKITQIMPRYIRSEKTAEITIRVENRGRSNLSFSYDLVLNHLLSEGKAKVRVAFDEVLFERTGYYEITYPIQASGMVAEEGSAVIDPATVVFCLSGIQQETQIEGKMSIAIVDTDEKEVMQKEYYRTSMEKIIRSGYRQPVYLAKIYLVSATDTYIIEKIKNVPFDQYVSNHVIESALYRMMQQERLMPMRETGAGGENGRLVQNTEGVQIAQGTTDIYIQEGGQRGDKFFSQEIVHSLGLGKVTLILGLEKESGKVVYGSSEIFEAHEEKGIDAELAACVNEENGSFLIGVRLISDVTRGKVSIHWTAIKDAKDIVVEKNEKRIFIKPNLLELTVRQNYYLEAVCENMVEKAVTWSVKDEGGFIDENGMYTAPSTAGVYEVVAQSVAFPDIKASIFVVVRNKCE